MYAPVDFIKAEIQGVDIGELQNNPLFDFKVDVNRATGEPSRKEIAQYKGLTILVFNSQKAYLSGSLHVYHNDGAHNYNRFNQSDFCTVLESLESDFGIKASQLRIQNLEVGVNFQVDCPVNEVLEACKLHKGQKFTVKRGNQECMYIQAPHDAYYLKLYNKGAQFGLIGNLMRAEVKYINWSKYRHLGFVTLEDYKNNDNSIFIEDLIAQWQSVILCERPVYLSSCAKYNDPEFWINLNRAKTRTTVKRHKDLLKVLNEQLGESLQDQIEQKIHEKFLEVQT